MEGDQREVASFGKLIVQPSSPIRTGADDTNLGIRNNELGGDRGQSQQERLEGINVAQNGKKKKNPLSPKSETQQRQTPGSIHMVVGVGPESTFWNHLTQRTVATVGMGSLDSVPEGTTVEAGELHAGESSSSRTQRRTLELAAKIGRRSLTVLVDSGSTGNYIDARECTARKLKIDKEDIAEELKMADGTVVKTEGRVQVVLKCGSYRGVVCARVFPGMNKSMILGIPWLTKENPHIDWTQPAVVVKQGQEWVLLPLAKSKRSEDTVHLANQISANQVKKLLKKKETAGAFLGFIRQVNEETTVMDVSGESSTTETSKWDTSLPEEIRKVLEEFDDVFPQDLPLGRPPVRQGHQFRIELEDNVPPVHRPLYKMSPLELEEAKKQIQSMLEHGFIRPSDSPYGAPVLFVPKKDGGLRFCIDYRWLNKKTVRNRYPLPLPEELFDRLGNAKVFSKIDLRSGYWQMPVKPEDVHKTAFKTRWGLYEFLVMPFGVTNAPAQFMNMMNDLLGDYLDDFVLVFLDDVLVYSADTEQHAKHLRKILGKLREQHLYAKASKCEMLKTSVEFLGQQISSGGMTPTEAKLKAVKDWTVPKDVRDVRSFLGFANYYRRFVKDFAAIADPLTTLTKKDVPWQWGPYQRKAFQQLKEALCTAPVLLFPDPKLPYTVVTNASGTAAGGVLMQDHGTGLQPLAFLSRRLKPTEQRYSAYERELAAVAYCLQSWRHYLEGCPGGVTVVTDHQPLVRLMDQPVLTRVQTRWLRLGLFQSIRPTIKYQPGKANIVADALSRSQRSRAEDSTVIKATAEGEDDQELFALSGISVEPSAEDQALWTKAYLQDPSYKTVFQQLRQGGSHRETCMTPAGFLAVKKGDQ